MLLVTIPILTFGIPLTMISVTCAIILRDNKILVTQRSEQMRHPLKWEFPGGKLNLDESEEDCIRREIREELNIEIHIIEKLTPQSFNYGDIQISLIPFVANYAGGMLKLAEHKDYLWTRKEKLRDFDWVPADVLVLDEFLKE